MFWSIGAVGGIGYLHNASPPMAMPTGLHGMLAAVAVSIIIATLAVMDVGRRFSRQRARRYPPWRRTPTRHQNTGE